MCSCQCTNCKTDLEHFAFYFRCVDATQHSHVIIIPICVEIIQNYSNPEQYKQIIYIFQIPMNVHQIHVRMAGPARIWLMPSVVRVYLVTEGLFVRQVRIMCC